MASNLKNKEVTDIFGALAQLKINSDNIQDQVESGYTCEDSKLLEIIIEHILLHWDDIMAVLIDELIQEEVIELNKLEDRVLRGNISSNGGSSMKLADKSMLGKFHDYKNVDLREITTIFDEYKQAEQKIKKYIEE